jgi:hypothetical protein
MIVSVWWWWWWWCLSCDRSIDCCFGYQMSSILLTWLNYFWLYCASFFSWVYVKSRFCGGSQGLSWAMEPRKEKEEDCASFFSTFSTSSFIKHLHFFCALLNCADMHLMNLIFAVFSVLISLCFSSQISQSCGSDGIVDHCDYCKFLFPNLQNQLASGEQPAIFCKLCITCSWLGVEKLQLLVIIVILS